MRRSFRRRSGNCRPSGGPAPSTPAGRPSKRPMPGVGRRGQGRCDGGRILRLCLRLLPGLAARSRPAGGRGQGREGGLSRTADPVRREHRCGKGVAAGGGEEPVYAFPQGRSEEHTSELQSLMRISYAVFCLKKKTTYIKNKTVQTQY